MTTRTTRTIRELTPAPASVIDPTSGLARYGSYEGSVPRIDLSTLRSREGGSPLGVRKTLRRLAQEKRWIYLAVATEEDFVAVAIARFGYAATCFGYVFDATRTRMDTTASVLAPPTACHVGDGMTHGSLASFRFGATHAEITRGAGSADSPSFSVHVQLGDIVLDAALDTTGAPPAITAIAPVGPARDRLVDVTEKRALLAVRGEITVRGRRRKLDGGFGGYDYTHGLLARRTMWRWAYALGRAKTGERVAFNLVQGFVGEPECAAWVEGKVYPLREGRFELDRDEPLSDWRVSTADGALDLRFKPGGMHSEHKNLGLVASRFVQPVGVYSGTLRVGGRELVLERVLGVTEDQDVLW